MKKVRTLDKSERIAVDELFDDGSARILRAGRSNDASSKDYGIDNWNTEKEDFVDQWKLEAFVGFPSSRKLNEGDVFFVRDGSKINNSYKGKKILPRLVAKKKHLIVPWDKSISIAREETKEQFFKLTVSHIANTPKERKQLNKEVEKNIKENRR